MSQCAHVMWAQDRNKGPQSCKTRLLSDLGQAYVITWLQAVLSLSYSSVDPPLKKIHDSDWEGPFSLFWEGLLNGRPGDCWWQCQMNHQPLFLRTVCKQLWGQSSSVSSCSLEVKSGKNLPWEHNVFWVPVKQLPLPTACFMGEEVVCKTAGDQTATELWSASGAEQGAHGALVWDGSSYLLCHLSCL